jgi:hypothetical protein
VIEYLFIKFIYGEIYKLKAKNGSDSYPMDASHPHKNICTYWIKAYHNKKGRKVVPHTDLHV